MTTTGITAALTVAAVLAACASDPAPVTDDAPPAAGAEMELAPRCEDLDPLPLEPPPEEQPDPNLTVTTAASLDDLDTGDAGDHGTAVDQARAWAEHEAGDHDAGMWQDNAHGALVFGFTHDVDRYAAALRERFGDGLWVVERPHGYADLLALTERVGAEVAHGSWEGDEPPTGALVHWGPSELLGRVTIGVYDLDDDRHAELSARFGTERICVQDAEPVQRLPLIGAQVRDASGDQRLGEVDLTRPG